MLKSSGIGLLIILLVEMYIAVGVQAAGKVFVGTAEYELVGAMSKEMAELAALELAEQNAQEQAGVYVLSYSEVQAGAVTVDEVKTLVVGSAQLLNGTVKTSYEEIGGKTVLYLRAEFVIDTDALATKMRDVTRKTEFLSRKAQADELIAEGDAIMLHKVVEACGKRNKYVEGIIRPTAFNNIYSYEENDDFALFLNDIDKAERKKIKNEIHRYYAEGLEKYRLAATVAPAYPRGLCRLAAATAGYGTKKTSAERTQEALGLLKKVLLIDPVNQDALWYYARIDWDNQLKFYERLFAINPAYDSRIGDQIGYSYMERAAAEEAQGNYAAAKRGYQRAREVLEKTNDFAPNDQWCLWLWLDYIYLAQLAMKTDEPLAQVTQWTDKASKIYLLLDGLYDNYWTSPYSRMNSGTRRFKKLREDYLSVLEAYLQRRIAAEPQRQGLYLDCKKKLVKHIIPPGGYIYRNEKGLGMFEDP